MSFTGVDRANAIKFANANLTILKIKKLYEKAPHLTSHLDIKIRDATENDYYIPASLSGSSKVVEVHVTKNLCELLSCNPAREEEMCNPKNDASYYYVGDDKYDLQCQPACFRTSHKETFDEDGNRAPDTLMMNFHNGFCRLVTPMVTILEKTFYRSDKKFEYRKNDMPTGFSRVASDDPTGCGWTYKFNATYCKYYDKYLDSDGNCSHTWYEKILDAVIGMSLINTIRSALRVSVNGKPFEPPENLPPLPDEIPKRFTVKGWKENIREDFVLPDAIDTTPKVIRSTDIKHERHKREALNESVSSFMKMRYGDDSVPDEPIDHESSDGKPPDKTQIWYKYVGDFFASLLRTMTTDPEFWVKLSVNVLIETGLSLMKKACVKLVQKLSGFVAKSFMLSAVSVGSKVLGSCLRAITVKAVTSMVIRIGARVAIMMAKIASAAASIIGWLFVGAAILDLIFTFWDPYGYNNEWTPELPGKLMSTGETALRHELSVATANYEFEQFASLILSDEEIMTMELETFIDKLTYLDSLVVNSEGSVIDKGDLIRLNGGTRSAADHAMTRAVAASVTFDSKSYEEYNRVFMCRVDVNRYMNKVSLGTVVASSVFTLLHLPVLAVFFLLVTLILLAIARLSLQSDVIVDAILEFRYDRNNTLI